MIYSGAPTSIDVFPHTLKNCTFAFGCSLGLFFKTKNPPSQKGNLLALLRKISSGIYLVHPPLWVRFLAPTDHYTFAYGYKGGLLYKTQPSFPSGVKNPFHNLPQQSDSNPWPDYCGSSILVVAVF